MDFEIPTRPPVKYSVNDVMNLFTTGVIVIERIPTTTIAHLEYTNLHIIDRGMIDRQLHILVDVNDEVWINKSRIHPRGFIDYPEESSIHIINRIVKETISHLEELGYDRYVTGD